MAGIPSLTPEDEKRLHPEALEWFYARRNEIQFEVPLEELSDDDLNTFLKDDEKREFQSCMEEISKGLATCTDMDEASHDLVTTASIGLSLVKFQVNSLLSMQKIAAKLAAQEYNQSLNKEKARLKTLLCPNRKDHESYFRKQIKDCRYTGQSFTQYLSSEEEQAFDKTIVDISRKKLDEIVSSDFRQFIDSKCWRSYFLLPSADYSLEGVPCLDFMFDVFAVVETRVWLKPGQKNFGDNIFDLP